MAREIVRGRSSRFRWPGAAVFSRARETRFLGETGFLIVLTLLGLALRAARLDFQPLWWDEGYSVWFTTHSLGQIAALTAEDIHPPLYYALLHGWTQLFGTGPAALRLPSVIFGTLAVPAIYEAGRRIFNSRRIALLAAALLALHPLHIFYSQEIRMYGLVALLSIGVIGAAWRVMMYDVRCTMYSVPGRATSYIVDCTSYIGLTTLALYTQYYAIFLPIGLTLYAAWHWRRDLHALARWLIAQAIVALLYLPWALYAAPRLVLYVSQKVVADADKPLGLLAYLARHLAAFLTGHLEGPLAPWWPLALVLLLPLAVGWWLIYRRRMADGRWQMANSHRTSSIVHRTSHIPHSTFHILHFTSVLLLTALALGWLISLRAPFFPERGERLLILALPPFVLLAAAGLGALWRRWRVAGYAALGLVVAASAASLAAFYTVPRYVNDDYRALIAHTVEQGLPGDTVFCVYPWQVGYWRAYAPSAGLAPLLSPNAEWEAALDDALAAGRVWFPAHLALGAILETDIEQHLAARGLPFVNEWHGPNTRLSAWAGAATNDTNFTKEDMGVRFALSGGETLMLQAIAGSTAAVPAANTVTPVTLAWEADASPPVLAVSVRLTDDLGQIWAQHDYEPLGGLNSAVTRGAAKGLVAVREKDSSLPAIAQNDSNVRWQAVDRLGLLIPAGMPPGRYRVELVLRPKGAERPLDASEPDGRVLGPAARLYELEVSPAGRPLTADRLPIAVRRPSDLGDGLRFLGFSADLTSLAPGDLRKVSLFWQSSSQPTSDYVAFVQLLPRGGNAIPVWEAPPGAALPTSAWAAGTLMRTQAAFRAPASLPDGRYRLIAGLYRPADGARLRGGDGRDYISLGFVTVRGRTHTMAPPTPQHAADATFGGLARLVGYDLALAEDGLPAGGNLPLTLHWQALATADRAYTVFVHLLDEAGAVRGYGDAEPGGGRFPTPGWLAGEYLADEHAVLVAADAPPGRYRLVVGFYGPATGERLKTPDGADQVVLEAEITVR